MKKILPLLLLITLIFSLISLAATEEEKIIYITFDDGPTLNTPAILDTLKKHKAKATFFLLDERIGLYSDFVKRIYTEGHSIGLHGVSHNVNKIYSTPSSPLEEMNKENETLYKALGFKTSLIRTPYGSYPYMSYDQYKVLISSNYKIWDWTVDPRDSVGSVPSLEGMIQRIEKDLRGNQTPIVLLHDRKSTANNLDALLSYLSEKGYKFEVIDENMDPVNFMELYGPAKNKKE